MLIMFVKKMTSSVQLGNMVSFLLLLFLVSSCSKLKDFDQQGGNNQGNIEFKIRVSDSNQQQEQKATAKPSSKNDYSSKFKAGDSFGLYMVPAGITLINSGNLIQNVKVTFDGSRWSSPAKWPAGVNNFDCYAYYPYKTAVPDPRQVQLAVKHNQADSTGFSVSDLLWAKATGVARETLLEFTFEHMISMLQVEVPAGDIKGNGPDHLLKINLLGVQTSGRLNLENGSFSNEGNSFNSVTFYRVEQASDVNYESSFTYRAYLPAQELTGKKKIKLSQGKQTQLMELNANLSLTVGESKRIEVKSEMFQTSYIPAGTFQMGAVPEDVYALADEKPRHWVKLTKGFYMGRYEVTLSQYAKFLNAKGVVYSGGLYVYYPFFTDILFVYNSSYGLQYINGQWVVAAGSENKPMNYCFYNGAKAYAKWIGGSLPTEAQWEYACRAGTTSIWSFGNDGNLLNNYAINSLNNQGEPNPVGMKLPNPWGLYDMHGNVSEFVSDYSSQYMEAPTENQALVDPIIGNNPDNTKVVVRGGYWYWSGPEMTSSNRDYLGINSGTTAVGFRVIFPE